jgi:hypothetical protein
MRADQREAIQVAANRIHIRTPAVNRVAILATGAELPAMDIRVAISALLTNVSKNFSHVAGITRDILVHPAQWISRFPIVVKFNSLPDRRPTRGCVAVLAGDGQRPMRVPHTRCLVRLSNQPPGAYQQRCKNDTPLCRPAHRLLPVSAHLSGPARFPQSQQSLLSRSGSR